MQKLCASILKKLGWKIEGLRDYPQKCVICVAPHTSNWDLIMGKLVSVSMGRKSNFLIKKTWFFFPMNILFNAIGGIPVDRSKKTSLTDQMAKIFAERDSFELAITPEGTRGKNSDWKKGFYYIALGANVPIVIAILDYGKKIVTFEAEFVPTGDVDKDLQKIKSYYIGATGKNRENFTFDK